MGEMMQPAEDIYGNRIKDASPTQLQRYRILQHASAIADLLNSEWEVPAALSRSWHTIVDVPSYGLRALSIVQQRGDTRFQAAIVSAAGVAEIRSGHAVTVAGAVLWLGLADVAPPVDWHIEL